MVTATGLTPRIASRTRALIVANGELPAVALVVERAALAGFVVAADGGADGALACGVKPDAVVGDLDSISTEARRLLGSTRLHHDADPERTDLQKALEHALARGANRIDVVGWAGGRVDHMLANLSVPVLARGRADVRLVDDWFEVRLVDGRAIVAALPGTVVSLVAIGRCEGVTTRGLRWELTDATLDFSSRGVHNEVRFSPAAVSARSGDLLLFEGRWVEHHA